MKHCCGWCIALLATANAFVLNNNPNNNAISRIPTTTALFTAELKLGAGGMADTRDPDAYDDEDPRKSIKVAPSFEEYMKQRNGASVAADVVSSAAAAAAECPAHASSSAAPVDTTAFAPAKPASFSPFGKKSWGPSGSNAQPAAAAVTPVEATPAASTASAKPANYSPFGKKYNMGSSPFAQSPGSPAMSSAASTPATASSTGPVDYDAVRQELTLMMDNPSWDDGSMAPILIRLAWHSSGTYDQETGTGGSNGAGMRFETEAADPENAGLEVARAFLEPIKTKFPNISYSDLWILAAYVGIEHTGGPVIPFTPGRTDHVDESYWTGMSYGRLPAAEKYLCPYVEGNYLGDSLDPTGKVVGWEGLCSHVRYEVFYRMGFNDQEIVALLCGGHVYGRCHPTFSGYAGPWVEHPTQFSNEYATDMIEDEWTLVSHQDTWLDAQGAAELRPAPGKRQFVNKQYGKLDEEEPNQMMLVSDMVLAWDPAFRSQLEVYAEDEARLKEDFGLAFKKLTELGCGFA